MEEVNMWKIFEKIKQYIGLVDDIIVDFFGDLKSLRYQLILWAYGFNIYILSLIHDGKADYKLAVAGIGLLTLVYGMYFQSKAKQAEMEKSAPTAVDDEPPADDRDPEKVSE